MVVHKAHIGAIKMLSTHIVAIDRGTKMKFQQNVKNGCD